MAGNHGNAGDSGHDAHAHHGPPPPPEPKTPMWLPAVGAALFMTVGLVWGLTPSSQDEAAPLPTATAASATPDAGAAPAKPAERPAERPNPHR